MRSVALSILFLFSMSIHAFTQDYSTWGEIYDYEVGDIFHFKEEDDGSIVFYNYSSVENIQVLNKTYSPDSNSVTYYQFVQKAIHTPEWPNLEFLEFYDTVTFDNLDDIFISDIIIVSEKYNFRKQSHFDTINTLYSANFGHYVDGCGLAYHFLYHFYGPTWWDDWRRELVYFKKGDEEWGTPHIVVGISETKGYIENLNCYPNPFTTTTTLSYTLDKPSAVIIRIFNSQGQQVDEITQEQPVGPQQIQWNAEGLPAGMYYFRIQAGDMVGGGKMVKIE